jgi:type II secretory pathway component PulK
MMRFPRLDRRGVMMIAAIVALTIASALLLTMVRRLSSSKHAFELELYRTQSQWLAESGIQRGAAKLLADPGYVGETWNIPPDQLQGEGANVTIQIETVESPPGRRQVQVLVEYPAGPDALQVAKTITVDLP